MQAVTAHFTLTTSFEAHEDFVRVGWGDGQHADFHWLWLRHNCPLERHPQTHERTLSPGNVKEHVGSQQHSVRIEHEELCIAWFGESERGASRFPLNWLRANAYAVGRKEPRSAASLAGLQVQLDSDGLLPADWRSRLQREGALIGRATGTFNRGTANPETTERLIEQLAASRLAIVGTHFGRIEDLRTDNTTNQNTDQLGYTNAGIDLHSDQPFLDAPPRYQLLHSMRAADQGGDSLLADADAIARWLAAHDHETYTILCETKLVFHRKQQAFERKVAFPLLERRIDGSHSVRSSYFTLAPFQLPFENMTGLYRALRRFEELSQSSKFLRTFLLQPGDLVLYDNHRMLHGRTEFRGQRWVRGVYFDEL